MNEIHPSPAAARMRLHRDRRRRGLRCLTIELRETEIDVLIGRDCSPAKCVAIRARSAMRYMRFSVKR
jgi:hypothetical protein